MIDFAKEEMIPELKRLWLFGFPEDTEYCDFYFDNYFSCDNCIAVTGKNGLETATYLFRGECSVGGKAYNAVYWYGGATWTEYRRKGNLSRSLDFLQRYCIENNIDIIAVRPVEETYSSYAKRGFLPDIVFQRTKTRISQICRSAPIRICGFDEFEKMRNTYLGDYCIKWDKKTTRYMYMDVCFDGGVVIADIDGAEYYAAYTLYKNELLIRETNCPMKFMQEILRSICAYVGYTGCVTIYTRLGDIPVLSGVTETEPMYYAHIWVSPSFGLTAEGNNWYINLTAD